jgi:uncharacterized repeat protein (TIGR02543 family)
MSVSLPRAKCFTIVSALICSVLTFFLTPASAGTTSREVVCGAGTYTITDGVASAGTTCTGALVISNDVTEIGTRAFEGAAITSLTLPTNLTTIRYAAFYGTNGYPSLVIPNSVTLIENQAFEQGQFTSLTIGNGLTSIGDQVFYRNYGTRINSITFGTNLTSIGYAAFQNFGVERLTIPDGVTTISGRAFDAISANVLVLPTSLTSLASDSFVYANFLIVKYCGSNAAVTSYAFNVPITCGAIVDFDSNLGSGSMNPQSSSTNTSLPSNSFTRSGFTFDGWNTQSDGLGTPYAAGGVFPFSTSANSTLYAMWLADLAPPAFTLSASSGSATTGSAISSYSISSTGGAIASYSISPAISNGTLSFSTSTGLLSGTPSTAAGATTYTITATNASGSASQTYTLTIDSPAPVVVYVPPTPVPFLKTLTPPQMRLTGGKLVCTAGTYQTGQTLDGVVQTSSTAFFTPTNYVFNFLVNGQAQSTLTKTISSNSVQWDLSIAPSASTVSCSVTVTANSLTDTEKSTSNTTGLSAANTTLAQATTDANNAYSAAQSANSTTYQKALFDNRALWRKQVENLRANYYETLARITSSGASRKMITDKSAALKAMITAQRQSAADYKASQPLALAAKVAANKVALDAKNAAIAKANANYGTFIESIGYGVLIP